MSLWLIGFIIDLYDLYGAFLKWWYPKMVGLFHGKSQSKMDDLGVPLFQETTIYLCVCVQLFMEYSQLHISYPLAIKHGNGKSIVDR